MTESDLMELAGKVEALEGPCRETDARIAHATCWRWEGWEDEDIRIESRSLEYVIERVENGFNSIWRNVPRYTASLDAAMSLVPVGMIWGVANCGVQEPRATMNRGAATVGREDDASAPVEAATPALALCVAALKARARASRLSPPKEVNRND